MARSSSRRQMRIIQSHSSFFPRHRLSCPWHNVASRERSSDRRDELVVNREIDVAKQKCDWTEKLQRSTSPSLLHHNFAETSSPSCLPHPVLSLLFIAPSRACYRFHCPSSHSRPEHNSQPESSQAHRTRPTVTPPSDDTSRHFAPDTLQAYRLVAYNSQPWCPQDIIRANFPSQTSHQAKHRRAESLPLDLSLRRPY
jgi:hypothetical protein